LSGFEPGTTVSKPPASCVFGNLELFSRIFLYYHHSRSQECVFISRENVDLECLMNKAHGQKKIETVASPTASPSYFIFW
jgi:hypothetical protein